MNAQKSQRIKTQNDPGQLSEDEERYILNREILGLSNDEVIQVLHHVRALKSKYG